MSDNNVLSCLSCDNAPEDENLDIELRPKRFRDFIGQESIKKNLHIYIEASKKRGDVLDHILFSGSQGLGKTTCIFILKPLRKEETYSTIFYFQVRKG